MRKQITHKKPSRILLSLLLLISIALTACGGEAGDGSQPAQEQQTQAAAEPDQALEKDDYYQAVNGALLDSWELDPDEGERNWFMILNDQVNEAVTDLIKETADKTDLEAGSDESNVRALYLTGMDQEARDENGFGQAASAFLQKVDEAASVNELMRACMEFNRDYGISSVFGISVGPDYQDSSVKVLGLSKADTGLSREIWFSEDEANQNRVSAFKDALRKFCVIEGYAEEEAQETAEQVSQLMKNLAEKSLTQSELYNPDLTYNLYTVSELENLYAGNISSEMIEEIYGVGPEEKVVVEEVDCIKLMGSLP